MSIWDELIDRERGIICPFKLKQACWPDIYFYDKQRELIESVRDNDETICVAGNELGKDFTSAFIALWWMSSRRPARCVTSSVQYGQLNDVLWGEIRQFIARARIKLPLHYNHMNIRQIDDDGEHVPLCELVGQCVGQNEALLGRHLPRTGTDGSLRSLPRTLFIADEASGFSNGIWDFVDTWAHTKLAIGNPWECENFFRKYVAEGDLPRDPNDLSKGYIRKIIQIKGEDSPNVRLGIAQEAQGIEPTNEILVPGVLDYNTYKLRRRLWNKIKQTIGIDAEFYEGAELKMFPISWLLLANQQFEKLKRFGRRGKAIGIDPAEGGDNTAWAVIDEKGVIKLVTRQTPNTTDIVKETIALMREYHVPASKVCFDIGGGGKQHADYMIAQGFRVHTVAFGESVKLEKVRGMTTFTDKLNTEGEKQAYKNRRVQMYHHLKQLMDPDLNGEGRNYKGFALPSDQRLRNGLKVLPVQLDSEGVYKLPPKRRGPGVPKDVVTIEEMLGHSPDEADAVVVALHALTRKDVRSKAGA